MVTASLVLRCVEDGRLRLDDSISQPGPNGRDTDASIRELLSHTTASESGSQFAYRPERLDALLHAVTACTGQSFREAVGTLLDRLGMPNSVPGSGRHSPKANGRVRATCRAVQRCAPAPCDTLRRG